jgi:hypothetical protein
MPLDPKQENDVRIDIHNISTIANKYHAAIVEIGLSAVQEDAVEASLVQYLIEGTSHYMINGVEFVFYVQEPPPPPPPADDPDDPCSETNKAKRSEAKAAKAAAAAKAAPKEVKEPKEQKEK